MIYSVIQQVSIVHLIKGVALDVGRPESRRRARQEHAGQGRAVVAELCSDAIGARRDPVCREGCEGGPEGPPPSRAPAAQGVLWGSSAGSFASLEGQVCGAWKETRLQGIGCPFPHLRATGRFREH